MQADIEALGLDTDVSILGVNAVGAEGGNDAMCQGRQLPWLQDTAEFDVWSTWNVTYRDVRNQSSPTFGRSLRRSQSRKTSPVPLSRDTA